MNRVQFYVLFFQQVLKWVALPALVGLFLYYFLVVNNSHSGSTCSGCGQHVKYYEGMTSGKGTAETTSPNTVNKDGVVEYKQKDNGPGSPSQQAFRQQQDQQKKQNLNNTTFSP